MSPVCHVYSSIIFKTSEWKCYNMYFIYVSKLHTHDILFIRTYGMYILEILLDAGIDFWLTLHERVESNKLNFYLKSEIYSNI